ncbi:MAG: sigma-70 region 4 domain protein [Ramlibacter sp.]|nr:sigma-70 region 4 domain protein [Ramlibacter sp.]
MNDYSQLVQQSTNEDSSGEWLPLPAVIAAAFPWKLDAPGWALPLPIVALSDPLVVAALDKRLAKAYEEALRRKLREPLAHLTLPEMLLKSPVRAGAVSEVRFHLSRHGTPRSSQPETLTIADAMPFIGRRPNRLLQCADRSVEVPGPTLHLDALELLEVPAKALRRNQTRSSPLDEENKKSRLAQRRHPFSIWHPLGPPAKWRKLRTVAPTDVRLTLEDGGVVTAKDPRFGWALLRVNGLLPLDGQSPRQVADSVKTSASEPLKVTWAWLEEALDQAAAMTTAEEVRALIEAVLPRNAGLLKAVDIVAGRYGLSGEVLTLEECGEGSGITRERVRQLQAGFEGQVTEGTVYAPALRRFAEAVHKVPLASIASLAKTFAADLGGQAPVGAITAARAVLGEPREGWVISGVVYPAYGLRVGCWSTRLAVPDVTAILRSARAMIARAGAFHVVAVAGDVSEELKAYISHAEVEAVIDSCEQFRWVNRDAGWGTLHGAGDAPVFTEVRKMLAVAFPTSLDITDIFAGLVACRRQVMNRENSSRFGGTMPPPWLFRKLLEMQPDLAVAQYDNFRLVEGVDPLSLMEGESEKLIFRTLESLGSIASWKELRHAIVDSKLLNPITFGVVLKSSSHIYQPGYGIYALRGRRFTIEKTSSKYGNRVFPLPASPARAVVAAADVIEFDVNQTSSTKGKRYVYAPVSAALHVQGTYLHHEDPDLRIRIDKKGQIARLAHELTERGVQPRETIRLTIDTVARTYSWRPSGS